MKKLLSLLVCACMVATFMAIPALAEADYSALIEECLTTEVKTAITKNLTLPSEWSDLPLTWESSNTRVISNDGKVTRPAQDTQVTLTAYQAGEEVKVLNFTVIAQGTKVWISENFYRPSLEGTQIRTSSGAAAHPLDFVEKTNTDAGRVGFYKESGSLAIAENPKKANDYAILATSNSTTDRTVFDFALPNGALPTGKVTVKWTLTSTGYDKTVSNGHYNSMKTITVSDDAGGKLNSFEWLSPVNSGCCLINGLNDHGFYGMTVEGTEGNQSYTNTFTTVYDFDAGTAKITDVSNGVLRANNTVQITNSTGKLKKFRIVHRSDKVPTMLNGNFYIDDIVITSTEQYIEVPERSTTLKAKWNDTSTSDYYSITTDYNDKYNLVQNLSYVLDQKRVGSTVPAVYEFCEYNNSLDLGGMTLTPKSGGTNITIHAGSDDRTPINTNGSYMGAGHGHTAGIVITVADGHGKTHADVGSRWSYDNKIWNLLRIENDTDLLFISDDKGATSTSTYSFHTINANTAVTLTHAGTAADNSEAINKEDISGTVKTKDAQIYDAYAPAVVKIYAINGGVKTDVTAAINAGETIEAEQLEFEETYTIMNPSKIADGLRANRPAGGYIEKPSLAVGEEMVDVKNVYQYNADGTMLTYMYYKFLTDMGKTSIGGIQYCRASDGDARGFGGGFYKYMPKVKELTGIGAYGGGTMDLDLTQPWRWHVGSRPNGYNIVRSDWEDESNPPNREVLYYADKEDPSKFNAAFTLGFLPIGSGDPEFRKDNLTGGAYYLYNTNKGYPTFISVDSIEAGTVYTGVAFKKVQEIVDNNHNYTSVIPVDYEDGKYYYIDYHKSGTDTITLPTTYDYEVVEKSDNVSYTSMDNLITTTADCSDKKYGYLVLKATNAETVRIADGAYDGVMGMLSAYFENDTNSDKTITAIGATYDENGKLVETVTFKDFKVEANKDVQKVFPFETKGASSARVFTFNSLNILQAATKSHHVDMMK